jgi:hypothetical protein
MRLRAIGADYSGGRFMRESPHGPVVADEKDWNTVSRLISIRHGQQKSSHVLQDRLREGRGRIEFVGLSHQYLQLTSLVGVS